MLLPVIFLIVTLLTLWYIFSAEESNFISDGSEEKTIEQKLRLKLDEALSEISAEEAEAQRNNIK